MENSGFSSFADVEHGGGNGGGEEKWTAISSGFSFEQFKSWNIS